MQLSSALTSLWLSACTFKKQCQDCTGGGVLAEFLICYYMVSHVVQHGQVSQHSDQHRSESAIMQMALHQKQQHWQYTIQQYQNESGANSNNNLQSTLERQHEGSQLHRSRSDCCVRE